MSWLRDLSSEGQSLKRRQLGEDGFVEHSVSQKLATLPPSQRLIIVSNSLILSLAISIFSRTFDEVSYFMIFLATNTI
ncbi:hypothetical protein [Prochlorococcus marinus]|uniref:Uncharacterized protein n=1 Tax=Prochlorococcus marinus str. PAC1 TaxID=59924 RepID=A0A0A2C7D7_PROMR|nr:hypothetical protein [Prochlorococcus marinus]KGG22281.1 hypothetical protein EV03_0175 [Prochlorococcus marinus str. PAC1]